MSIEAYLDELCAALQTDPLRRDEIRLETHLHLRDRAKALLQQGLSAEEAEERAVLEFGPAPEIAIQLAQSSPPAARWNPSKHLYIVGALLIGFGAQQFQVNLVQFLKFTGTLGGTYFFSKQPLWVVAGEFLSIPTAYILLGAGMLQGKLWVKIPVLLLTLLNPNLLITFLALSSLLRHPSQGGIPPYLNGARFFTILTDGGSTLFLIGLYAIWAYSKDRKPKLVVAGNGPSKPAD